MSGPLGFHARDGWYFHREPDGSVTIYASTPSAATRVTLDANTWASVVASVSVTGETAETFNHALTFHGVSRHASPHCACGINDAGQRYVDPICRRDRRLENYPRPL